jgi:hypothetical protein
VLAFGVWLLGLCLAIVLARVLGRRASKAPERPPGLAPDPTPGKPPPALLPRSIGDYVLPWLWEPAKFFWRRVESVSFLDGRSIRRHVSVDFTLPVSSVQVDGRDVHLVPLAFFVKGPVLFDFDLKDEMGMVIPAAFGTQSNELTMSTLAAAAEVILGVPPSLDVIERLRAVAHHEPLVAPLGRASAEWHRLEAVDSFRWLLEVFKATYLLYALLPASDPRGRRVLKYAHTVPLYRRAPTPAQLIGWQATSLRFQLPAVGDSRSYHFEVETPEGLGVTEMEIVVKADVPERRRFPGQGRRLAHAYISEEPLGASGSVTVRVQAVRRGLVTAAFLATSLTAGLLTFAAVFTPQVRASSSATSLLLAIATLASALCSARPGEHGLTSYFLRGIRWTTALTGLLAFVAAGLSLLIAPVAMGGSPIDIRPLWIRPTLVGLAVVGWSAAGALLITFVRAGSGLRHRPA